MIARRTTGVVTTLLVGALLTACGSSEEGPTGCHGDADGGSVVVAGQTTTLTGNITAGVGSIDVNPDSATAIVTLSEGEDPAKVRALPVEVGTVISAGGTELTVVQICRSSLTVEASTPTG